MVAVQELDKVIQTVTLANIEELKPGQKKCVIPGSEKMACPQQLHP